MHDSSLNELGFGRSAPSQAERMLARSETIQIARGETDRTKVDARESTCTPPGRGGQDTWNGWGGAPEEAACPCSQPLAVAATTGAGRFAER